MDTTPLNYHIAVKGKQVEISQRNYYTRLYSVQEIDTESQYADPYRKAVLSLARELLIRTIEYHANQTMIPVFIQRIVRRF